MQWGLIDFPLMQTVLNKMVLTLHGIEHVGFELHQQDVLDVIKEPVCSYCDTCEKIKDLVHMY